MTATAPAQLSVAVGAVQVTTAKHRVPSVPWLILLGQPLITGASSSLTVTVKVQSAELFPLASVAWQVTVVVPFGKVEPLGGVQVVVEPGQLSLAVVV